MFLDFIKKIKGEFIVHRSSELFKIGEGFGIGFQEGLNKKDNDIYLATKKRIKRATGKKEDREIIIELAKEIDYYRRKIKRIEKSKQKKSRHSKLLYVIMILS